MLVAIVVMIPAIWTFLTVLQESKLKEIIRVLLKMKLLKIEVYGYQDEDLDMDTKKINLYFNGEISDEIVTALQNAKNKSEDLKSLS